MFLPKCFVLYDRASIRMIGHSAFGIGSKIELQMLTNNWLSAAHLMNSN